MNQEYLLGKLSEIVGWDTDQSREQFAWLRLMSNMKYDGYQDFLAGVRFIESLVDWLQQFPTPAERITAYEFVRRHLVYVSQAEMNHLVELFYPDTVYWRILQATADHCRIPAYRVWADPAASASYGQLLRQSLFIELSDGARIDVFRRANAGIISNEQVVTAPRIISTKWDELLDDLRRSLDMPDARFAFIFLVDDFVGSGTTLLRWEKDRSRWKGKLMRFWEDLEEAGVIDTHFEHDWTLCVHHYLATHQATTVAQERCHEVSSARRSDKKQWFERVEFSYGMSLPQDLPLSDRNHSRFLELVQTYYDDAIETKHMTLGGEDARLGFGKCALPLILDHNTPNNSVALLWAETSGSNGKHAMRPLFRRRQRHA